MRKSIRGKGNLKIFIEYDLTVGETLTPMYRLLIDLALKEALGRSHSAGDVYMIIDEFKLLPKLQHIDDALNFGRSLGIKVSQVFKILPSCMIFTGRAVAQLLPPVFQTYLRLKLLMPSHGIM